MHADKDSACCSCGNVEKKTTTSWDTVKLPQISRAEVSSSKAENKTRLGHVRLETEVCDHDIIVCIIS